MGLGNEPFFSGSLPSHGANYYILKLYKLSSSGFLFFGSSKLEFYTFYYHPKDFVGFTFLGHRGLFIPSLSLSTPALKGYTQHIHIGMATNSRVWVTEGRFHYKFYSQSPIKLGLVSTKLDLGYRLLISRVLVPKVIYQIS